MKISLLREMVQMIFRGGLIFIIPIRLNTMMTGEFVVTYFICLPGAVKALDLVLSDDERNHLEEPYVPHPLAGVMAQNRRP